VAPQGGALGRQHEQQQAVALWVQQPGLGAKRFLARRILRAGAQVECRGDPGVEQRKGDCSIRLTLQAQPKSPQLPRLGPTSRWPIHLQPAASWPGQPPVAGAQPRLRLNLQQGAVEAGQGGRSGTSGPWPPDSAAAHRTRARCRGERHRKTSRAGCGRSCRSGAVRPADPAAQGQRRRLLVPPWVICPPVDADTHFGAGHPILQIPWIEAKGTAWSMADCWSLAKRARVKT